MQHNTCKNRKKWRNDTVGFKVFILKNIEIKCNYLGLCVWEQEAALVLGWRWYWGPYKCGGRAGRPRQAEPTGHQQRWGGHTQECQADTSGVWLQGGQSWRWLWTGVWTLLHEYWLGACLVGVTIITWIYLRLGHSVRSRGREQSGGSSLTQD